MSESDSWVGHHVVERRKSLGGMTQKDLIRITDVSEGTIGPLERQGVLPKKAETRYKICRGLRWVDLALDWLDEGREPDKSWERVPTTDDLLHQIVAMLESLSERFDQHIASGEGAPDQPVAPSPQARRPSSSRPSLDPAPSTGERTFEE